MKYIELFWNRLYYCIFNCDKKTQNLLNRFFECLFYYLKFYRNRKGNNTRIPYNEIVGICVSDYIMIGFTCLLIWTLFNLVSISFPCVSLLPLGKTAFILVSVVPCLFVNYFFALQKDSFWNAKGLHLFHSYKSMHYLHANICQNRVFWLDLQKLKEPLRTK